MKPLYDSVMRTLKRRYTAPAASSKDGPWEVLLFTALTARSKDEQVEPVFRRLMASYPTPEALAKASVKAVERAIRTIGLYRTKARNAVALARTLVSRHGGRVPDDLDTLVALPGVGRKTASCVMVYAFGEPAVAVDTHVHRIANRLGWAETDAPEETERALRAGLPRRHWLDVNRVMVQFGRDICVPGQPKCWMCPVAGWCAYPKKTPPPVRSEKVKKRKSGKG